MNIIIYFENNSEIEINNVISRKIDHDTYKVIAKEQEFEFKTSDIKYVTVMENKKPSVK